MRSLRRDDERANRGVARDRRGGLGKSSPQGATHCVACFFAVEPERGDVVIHLERQDLRIECHRSSKRVLGLA